MKTKKLLVIFAALALIAALLCACAPEVLAEDDFFAAYGNIKNAKSASQVITVSQGSDELAKTQKTFNLDTGKVAIVRNELGKAEATSEESFDKANFAGSLKAELLASVNVNENSKTLTGSLSTANAKTALGIDGAQNVNVTLVLNDDLALASLTVTYTSANGNSVKIATTFNYA